MEAKMDFDSDETIGYAVLGVIGIAIAWFIPGLLAQMLGWGQAHDELVAWAAAKQYWLFIPLLFVYVLSGFFVLVAVLSASAVIAYALFIGIKTATIRLAEATENLVTAFLDLLVRSVRIALQLFIWSLHLVADRALSLADSSTAYIRQLWAERQELRRLYREEFADQFRSFKEFKDHLNGSKSSDEQESPKVDPYEAAIRLFGLTEIFTRAELEDRYRRLMRGVHPDVAGPNELATQLNQARDLIKNRKGWT